ncbi:MAG: DUF3800 domain-containing protein [Theionarchaea archaeon]|nr:DUF3800 domain-containing protein [Theionarchaea archaeon]
MFLCFADESGDDSLDLSTTKSKFFVLCSLQIRDKDSFEFEDRISEFLDKYNLPKRANLKKLRRGSYDYPTFKRFGKSKKHAFWTELYEVLNESPVTLIASVINKENLVTKYIHPDNPLERAYKHLIEKIDYFLQGENEIGAIIFDESYERDRIRRKHLYWKSFGTEWQKIKNIYRSPLFIREDESFAMQMADLCAYNVYRLFNQGKCDYFKLIENLFHLYVSKDDIQVAIKVFPISKYETRRIYECGQFAIDV